MSNLSEKQRVVEVLKKYPLKKFSSRQIAEMIVFEYAEDYSKKKNNPRFADKKGFIMQVASEIGAHKNEIVKSDKHVFWQDKPSPRVFWYDPENTVDQPRENAIEKTDEDEIASVTVTTLSEFDLYPILFSYLKSVQNLHCQWIDDKRSSNTHGGGGNKWLHPDIVAMQALDEGWDPLVMKCAKEGSGQRLRLWSFEVKLELTRATARSSYFQAVSNSSWANEGYLVAAFISPGVDQELRMLSALHGIGVILLNPENPTESDMILPARSRAEVDWQSVNRLVEENKDFKDYIELVSAYYSSKILRPENWKEYSK